MIGYRSAEYAQSLAEFGRPIPLPECGAWILERAIPNSHLRDAMGCYPLFCCADWRGLPRALESIAGRLVSLSVVIDPFAALDESELRQCFDVVVPFKEHFVVDAGTFSESQISKHHRYYARRALRDVSVEMEPDPPSRLGDWCRLYDTLIARHGLRGIKAFSHESFGVQLRVPGLVMFVANGRQGPIGAHLWFVQDGVAYSHLAAFSDAGYEIGAAYALYWKAISTFCTTTVGPVAWIDLGAGAGSSGAADDGLTAFKRGWSPHTRTKFFCGRVFDRTRYDELLKATDQRGTNYFPAYRAGEF